MIIKEGDLESLKLIIESYIQLLGFTCLFFVWFFSEDNDGQTILEICVKYRNNKDIIK